MYTAKIAQLVEHDLAKVGVAGSSPVFRSKGAKKLCNGTKKFIPMRSKSGNPVFRSMLEKVICPDGGMVDTKDLKSFGFTAVGVQVPLRVHWKTLMKMSVFLFLYPSAKQSFFQYFSHRWMRENGFLPLFHSQSLLHSQCGDGD